MNKLFGITSIKYCAALLLFAVVQGCVGPGDATMTFDQINKTGSALSKDDVAPTLSISAPSVSSANQTASIVYTVTYTGANAITLADADVTINLPGGVTSCIKSIAGSGTETRTVTLSGCLGNGTAGISIAAATASSAGGKLAAAAGPSGPVTIDNTAPVTLTVVGSSYINSQNVTAYTVSGTCSEESGAINITAPVVASTTCSSSTWSANLNLSSVAPGSVTFSVSHSDAAGNSITNTSLSVTKDTTAPSSQTITIASGSSYTTSSTVNLTLSAADVPTQMYITNTSGCTTDGTWEAYSTTKTSWTLGQNNATATVYAAFKDAAGNVSTCANDSIIHDNIAPTVTITSGPSTAIVNSAGSSSFTVTYGDADSVTLAPGNVTTTGTPVCTVTVSGTGTVTRTVTLSSCTGNGTVAISLAAATASDNAGNSAPGTGASATFIVDNTTQLTITGTSPITAGSCTLYTITAKDVANAASNVGANLTVTLSGKANGNYYASVTCSSFITTATISAGISSVGIYYKNTVAEVVTLSAAATGLTSGTLPVTINPDAANKLAFTTQPSSPATAGISFSTQPAVTIQDVYGNRIYGATDNITLSPYTNGACTVSGGGSLSNGFMAAATGLAAFSTVNYTSSETLYLKATATGLISTCSSAISVGPGPAHSSNSTITVSQFDNYDDNLASPIVTITLRDLYNNPIAGVNPTFSSTGTLNGVTQAGPTNGSGVATGGGITSSTAELKTLSINSPAGLTGVTATVNFIKMVMEVPIEMIENGLSSNTTATTFLRSQTSLYPSDYDGVTGYTFEVVCKNTDTSGRAVYLMNGTTSYAALTITAGTSVPTRFSMTTAAPVGGIYQIKIAGTPTANDLICYSARIIVRQFNATKTKIYIPLVSGDQATYSNTDLGSNIATTTSPSYGQPIAVGRYSIWQKDSTRYATLATTTPFTFETVSSIAGASSMEVALYNKTTSTLVANTSITSQSSPTLNSVSFANNATNFTDTHDFDVRFQTTSGQTATLYKAGVWIRLEGGITAADIYYRIARSFRAIPAVGYAESRALIDLSRFRKPVAFHEMVGMYTTAESGTSSLTPKSAATSDSSLAGSAVGGSSLGYTDSKTRNRSSSLSLSAGLERYFSDLSGTRSVDNTSSFMVIQVNQ